jgi:hypothetical protein
MASALAMSDSGVAEAPAGREPLPAAVGVAKRLKLAHGRNVLLIDVHGDPHVRGATPIAGIGFVANLGAVSCGRASRSVHPSVGGRKLKVSARTRTLRRTSWLGCKLAASSPTSTTHDIAAGEDWEARLGRLIEAADTVFVISPDAAASDRCAWEVERTVALKNPLLPIVGIVSKRRRWRDRRNADASTVASCFKLGTFDVRGAQRLSRPHVATNEYVAGGLPHPGAAPGVIAGNLLRLSHQFVDLREDRQKRDPQFRQLHGTAAQEEFTTQERL